jgi:arabinogalactan endo-1,4-beta-galactosidase
LIGTSIWKVMMQCVFAVAALVFVQACPAGEMEAIRVAKNGSGFVYETSGREFVPWGFNYDRDAQGRLLEDYWEKEWPKVEADFRAMKRLGANVVRIHLQAGRFLDSAEKANEANLARLGRLVELAEKVGLYLDITGLGCYHEQDVPAWYDRLSEEDRWKAQAVFWEAVAQHCAKSPAVFCYDLMNEPVVPGGTRKPGDWLGPSFAGSCFVQCITLDQKNRPRPAIARQWCRQLTAAIRRQDRRHLVTVGLLPWSLDRPGITSGFVPKEIVGDVDFVCVHIYPSAGKVGEAIDTLKGFCVGKPVVVEEMFPLNCSIGELESFVDQSAQSAQPARGWIGFYWGKTAEEYRKSATIQDAIVADWLEWFARHGPPRIEVGFIIGADISWVQEQEDKGLRFSDQGAVKDILTLLKDRGFNSVRLRIFNDPKARGGYSSKGYCDLEHTLRMARRVHAAGMHFLLDFHYSDTWADPSHQSKPAAWTSLHGPQLEKAIHDYTRDVVLAMKQQGTPPAMVQIGNEVSNGFLWPDGNVWKSGNWQAFSGLIKAGVAGAKDAEPAVKILLHLAWGGQNAKSRAFLDRVIGEGVRFDCLGQSYYPKWHGTLDELKANLTDLSQRYPQDIMVVEYSVPNVRKINDIVHGLPGGKGRGTFIWEPTRWEGPALFDRTGKTKVEIEVYGKMAQDFRQSGRSR